ncbi:helix-turn-helix transcriptional regulator [Streptomyces roseoverticillatus]|uniref:helix-turn-helix domain-containing protein n=1 Tax=Streptomyces roseoverticillatus TaxID=66429 RepID=UPI0033D8D2EE
MRAFNGRRFREAREAARKTQAQVGEALGVRATVISRYESGALTPPPEKLPLLAKHVGWSLDALFPRQGLPNLADLRADAGISQKDTKHITKTASASPVRKAEKGITPLAEVYVEPLAKAYGVTVEQLRAAQERSPGRPMPAPASVGPPQTLPEKITYLLEHTYPGEQAPPSDREIADRINEYAGAVVITEEGVCDLRTGTQPAAKPIVIEGLAEVFGVESAYFQDDDETVKAVIASLKYLAAKRQGEIIRTAARGLDDTEVPAEVLTAINQVVAELQARGVPGAGGSRR